MSREHLWVYGSLRRGCANQYARMLESSARYVGWARVQARLYRIDQYPGIRLVSGADEWVVGDIFRVTDPQTLLILDDYEGPNEYRRVNAEAVLETGERIQCWVYEYIGPVSEDRRILSGDWLADSDRANR